VTAFYVLSNDVYYCDDGSMLTMATKSFRTAEENDYQNGDNAIGIYGKTQMQYDVFTLAYEHNCSKRENRI
jgi:hypothetical protein